VIELKGEIAFWPSQISGAFAEADSDEQAQLLDCFGSWLKKECEDSPALFSQQCLSIAEHLTADGWALLETVVALKPLKAGPSHHHCNPED